MSSHEPSKRNSQVVAQWEYLPTLIVQVVDELTALLAVLTQEGLLQLKYGSVYLNSSVLLKHSRDRIEGVTADCHLKGEEVTGTLRSLDCDLLLLLFAIHFKILKILIKSLHRFKEVSGSGVLYS